jgi:NADPH-dependent ferric siderophore reductase
MTARTNRAVERLIGQFFESGEVASVELVAGRMRRITLAVGELDWLPGQQIRVCTGDVTSPSGWLDGMRRTYSVWDYGAGQYGAGQHGGGQHGGGLLSLCVLDHGDGPGARWARCVTPGQEVLFSRPEGNMVIRPAAYHLFAGEETASAAFGPMVRSLVSGGAEVCGVIEVGSPADRLPLPGGQPFPASIAWRYRGGAPAASSPTLIAAVAGLALPAEPGSAYLAGEARTVQAISQHLVRDRGWPRRAIRTKPFWTPGKSGLD